MVEIVYKSIGVIHSPHKEAKGTPIQPTAAAKLPGRVEIYPEYAAGLQDLDGFSHVILLYHFDRVGSFRLLVKPFLDTEFRGVFATRAPTRPNPIGLSIVELVGVEGNYLDILGVDALDGTPLLDLKPYVDRFDVRQSKCQGWLEDNLDGLNGKQDDGRFTRG